MRVKVGELSRMLFCPACGVPAVKADDPQGNEYWKTSCHHAARVVRMGPKRRAEVAAAFRAGRPERNRVIADCEGNPA
jgi:hypothetical protein